MTPRPPTDHELADVIARYGAPVHLTLDDEPPILIGWVQIDHGVRNATQDLVDLLRAYADAIEHSGRDDG